MDRIHVRLYPVLSACLVCTFTGCLKIRDRPLLLGTAARPEASMSKDNSTLEQGAGHEDHPDWSKTTSIVPKDFEEHLVSLS